MPFTCIPRLKMRGQVLPISSIGFGVLSRIRASRSTYRKVDFFLVREHKTQGLRTRCGVGRLCLSRPSQWRRHGQRPFDKVFYRGFVQFEAQHWRIVNDTVKIEYEFFCFYCPVLFAIMPQCEPVGNSGRTSFCA